MLTNLKIFEFKINSAKGKSKKSYLKSYCAVTDHLLNFRFLLNLMGLEKLCTQWNCSQIHCWYYSCAGVSMLNSFRKCYMMLNILNNGPVMNVGPVYLELTGCWLRRLRLTATQCTPTPSWNINGNSDVEFLLDLTNLKPRLWSPARSSQCCVHTAPATADLRVSCGHCGSWHDDIMTILQLNTWSRDSRSHSGMSSLAEMLPGM